MKSDADKHGKALFLVHSKHIFQYKYKPNRLDVSECIWLYKEKLQIQTNILKHISAVYSIHFVKNKVLYLLHDHEQPETR